MNIAMQAVIEFHQKMNLPIGDTANPDPDTDTDFRFALITEEFLELQEALFLKKEDGTEYTAQERIVAVAGALGDLVYTVAGAAVTWGIDLGAVFGVIHDSNMTKSRGYPNKCIKGPDYAAPDIQGALDRAARDIKADGYGDDSWWPVPQKVTVSVIDVKNPDAFSKTLLGIKSSFVDKEINPLMRAFDVSDVTPDPDVGTLIEVSDAIPEEIKDADTDKISPKGVLKGIFTAYGAFIFDCPCERSHAVSYKQGSRGGLAAGAETTCICGRAFKISFEDGKSYRIDVTEPKAR